MNVHGDRAIDRILYMILSERKFNYRPHLHSLGLVHGWPKIVLPQNR